MTSKLALSTVLLAACAAPGAGPSGPTLTPFEAFFEDPSAVDAPRLSPDGRWLAWVAAADGARNLWVAPTAALGNARAVTAHTGRGIEGRDVSGNVLWRWTEDSRRLLYFVDRDGDERRDLWLAPVERGAGAPRALTEGEASRVRLVALSRSDVDAIAIEDDARAPGTPDLFRLDLATGARELLLENPGFLGFVVDARLRPRAAMAVAPGPVVHLLRAVPAEDGPPTWEPLAAFESQDLAALFSSIYQGVARCDPEGRALYVYDSRGRDTAALVALDLDGGPVRPLVAHPALDLGGVLFEPASGRPQAVQTEGERRRWWGLEADFERRLRELQGALDGDVQVVDRARDDRTWVVREDQADLPTRYWLYRPEERALRPWPAAEHAAHAPRTHTLAFTARARDGFPLVAYLTFPRAPGLDHGGHPVRPLPAVMIVHGGPDDERASYSYSAFVQWLADRGYAVLVPNFRGSPGFGKAFSNGQYHEWGGRMSDDLLDVLAWTVDRGYVDPERVGILGGSYGGYAVLVAMTRDAGVFRCGIDLVGPSDLEGSLPHWDPELAKRRFGDPRTAEGRAELRARSPVHAAHLARDLLLIGQGDRDARVPTEQAERMVAALQAVGAPVVYVLFPDEGHGLARSANARAFWRMAEVLLARQLGGRAEPVGDALEGSSARVLAGRELVPGLPR